MDSGCRCDLSAIGLQIPSIHYSSAQGGTVVLRFVLNSMQPVCRPARACHHRPSASLCRRYFYPSHAEEYFVPALELRQRDANTGDRLPADVRASLLATWGAARPEPVRFDTKGNYGVAVHWSDGHYADIFSYEVLKRIAEDAKTAAATAAA